MKTQQQDLWALQGVARDQSNTDIDAVLIELAEWDDSPERERLIAVIADQLGMPHG